MQSVLIGGGAVLASALPWMLTNLVGMSSGRPDIILMSELGQELPVSLASAVPATVHVAFYIGAVVFFCAVMVTIITTKEDPPEDMEAFRKMKESSKGPLNFFVEIGHGIRSMPKTMRRLALVQFFTWFGLFCMWIYFIPGTASQVFGGQPLGSSGEVSKEENLYLIAAVKEVLIESREGGASVADGGEAVNMTLEDYFARVNRAVAEGWGEVEELTPIERRNPLFTTTSSILLSGETNPSLQAELLESRLVAADRYREGVEWGGLCFSVYNLIAFGFAFALLGLVKFFTARNIHLICLAAGGIGLGSAAFMVNPYLLMVSMVLVGIAWASILSMPYAMLSNVIPGEKMGFYMGVFNFFIVIPQIVASLGMGLVVQHLLGGEGINAIILGGASMLLASVACLRVGNETETGEPNPES